MLPLRLALGAYDGRSDDIRISFLHKLISSLCRNRSMAPLSCERSQTCPTIGIPMTSLWRYQYLISESVRAIASREPAKSFGTTDGGC
jgi:hypothetical protein